ncbi:MAG: hypothetical protein AMJ92_00055 [candidate division Zixibacteria bacterium SM23_81]|nr:MAG: hypothetical protein AMJ92_00055 [candidate division Zixibacteria bacterium SM23_81]
MKSTQRLKSKISKLEERTGIKRPPEIPAEDCFHTLQGSPEEVEAEMEKRKAELVEKYGPRVLRMLVFVTISERGATERVDLHDRSVTIHYGGGNETEEKSTQ